MHIFNRIVVVVLDVLLIGGAALVLLVTFGVLTPQQVLPEGMTETALGTWFASFATTPPTVVLMVTVLAGLGILTGLILLALELRPAPQARSIIIREDALGRVTVQPKTVRDILMYAAAHLPDVLQVQSTLEHSPQGLTIHCRTALTPEAHIPNATAALQARMKQAVEQHLGMKVATVTVEAQIEPLAGMTAPDHPRALRRVLR